MMLVLMLIYIFTFWYFVDLHFQCLTAYVSFEVQEAAYDIACPDATCEKQGVLSLVEIEALAPTQLIEKHKKFRLYNGKSISCSKTLFRTKREAKGREILYKLHLCESP